MNEKYDLAIENYQKALKGRPSEDKFQIYDLIGNCYYSRKDYRNALVAYNKSLMQLKKITVIDRRNKPLQPENVAYKRGVCNSYLNNHLQAVSDFQYAISRKPKNIQFHLALGIEYKNLKEYQKAADTFNNALKIEKQNVGILKNLAIVYYLDKRYNEALIEFEKAYQLDPENYEILYHLALCYDLCNEPEKAIKFYEILLKSNDQNDYKFSYLLNIALNYYKIDKLQLSETYFLKALSLKTDSHEIYYYLALMSDKQKDSDKCVENMKKAAFYGNKEAQNYLKNLNINW